MTHHYHVRKQVKGELRHFFKLSNGEWAKERFDRLITGDRFIFTTEGTGIKSGVFIAASDPYIDPHNGLQIDSIPHNEAPNKETITLREITKSAKNSGVTPVFIQGPEGVLIPVASAVMSISGAIILNAA